MEAVLRRAPRPGPQPPRPDGDDLQPGGQGQRHPQLEQLRQPAADPGLLRPPPGRRPRRPERSLTAGAPAANPVDGDTVQLQVRVHNYSLDTAATGVPVEFWAVPRDADDENNVGLAGSSWAPSPWTPSPPWAGCRPTSCGTPPGWPPPGPSSTASSSSSPGTTPARAPPTPGTTSSTPGPTATTTPPPWTARRPARHRDCDRLIDPFTGQLETLEAGQNKQGWGEVTIFPRSPAPGPLAAAARPQSRTARPAAVRQRRRPRHRPARRPPPPRGRAPPAPPPPTDRQRPGGARPPGRHRHRRGQLRLPRQQQQRHAAGLRRRPRAGRAAWWA